MVAALFSGTASAQGTLTLIPTTLPAGTSGSSYSQTITAAGGNAPYTFDVSPSSPNPLPTGLSISSGGVLSGTPASSGATTFELRATDVDGNTGLRTYTLTVGSAGGGGIAIHPATLPDGSQGVGYSQTVSATGGTGGNTFSRTSGSLPTGLSLNASTGSLSGTPSAAGAFTFTLEVRDSSGNTDSQSYTVNIGGAVLTFTPTSLPAGQQGTAYNQSVTAQGGSGTYTYSVAAGSLPAGLALNTSTGAITGTPGGAGASSFTIRAIDTLNQTGTQSYSIYIGSNILTLAPTTLPNGSRTTPYNQTITASGGLGGYSYAITSGSLPAGMSMSSGGALSGTPSATGVSTFTVQATDSGLNTGSRTYNLTIDPAPIAINPTSLPVGTVGTAYAQTLTASNGTGPYTFAVTSGSLPTGLSLSGTSSTTASIAGNPTAAGTYTFTVQATDALAVTGSRTYSVTIGSNVLTLSPTALPNGTQNTAYSTTVTGSGGTGPYTFSLASGTLPAGLSVSSSGTISGTPTGSGQSNFTLAARDTAGNVGSQAYSINIGTNSLSVTPTSVPAATQAVAYSQTLSINGGTGPYTFTLGSGALPAGLSLSSSGVISGTPTGSGASSFTVRVRDSRGNVGSQSYSINVGTASLTLNPASLPAAAVGGRYNTRLSGAGGTAPYAFTVVSGALPAGLSLNASTGVISGTPRSAGTASFTIQVTDINGNIGSRAFSLINRADPSADPEVRGLISAQVASAQRFAAAQTTNVARHLESLHGRFDPCSFNNAITPPIDRSGTTGSIGNPIYADPSQLYSPNAPYGPAVGYGPQPQQPLFAVPAPQQPGMNACASDMAAAVAVWTAGSFQFGSMTPAGTPAGSKFTSGGLTAGVDYRVNESLIVGAALGYGADRTDVGSNGSRSDASSFSGMLYASWRAMDALFIDGAAGFGTLGYDNKRWVTGESALVNGTRKGSYFFGAVAASYEMGRDSLKFAPYIGADFMSASLDGYSENGSTASLLTYDKTKFSAVSGSIGLRGSIDMPMSYGTLSPTARIEYRQSSQGAFDQPMFYSDLGSTTSTTFSQASTSRGTVTGAIGLQARAFGGLVVALEYALTGGSDSLVAQAIRANLKLPF